MSILVDDLRDSGMHPICEQAAEEIESLECAYALLFTENSKRRADTEQLRAVLREIGEWDHRGDSIAEAWDESHGRGTWLALLDA